MTETPKKRSGFYFRKPEPDADRLAEIIRSDDIGEIRKTCGSIGYQVFVGGKFKSFVGTLEEANSLLDKLS